MDVGQVRKMFFTIAVAPCFLGSYRFVRGRNPITKATGSLSLSSQSSFKAITSYASEAAFYQISISTEAFFCLACIPFFGSSFISLSAYQNDKIEGYDRLLVHRLHQAKLLLTGLPGQRSHLQQISPILLLY